MVSCTKAKSGKTFEPEQNLPHGGLQKDVEGVVPMSVQVCDFNPRKTCLAELGGVGKERVCRGLSSQEN